MNSLKQLLSEEFLETTSTGGEIHKNPGILLFTNSRGIVLSNGDLYITSDPYMIHSSLMTKVNRIDSVGLDVRGDWHMYPRQYGVITVQQKGHEDNMYIGESNDMKKMDLDKEWILNVFKKAKEKNPHIDFIYKKI